jgi:outer membrane protein assembly factor BamB
MLSRWIGVGFLWIACCARGAEPPAGVQTSDAGIRHSFLVCGSTTAIVGEDGRREITFPYGTRDGFVLPGGSLLLAVNKSKDFPGGGVVELTREGKVVFSWKGTQAEVNSVEDVGDGRILLTEAGPKPRLLEIDHDGRTRVEFALRCQTANAHMQTRMARKLPNGNYLVPHLLDKVVREYTPAGEVVWEYKTPDEPAEAWPFTAIRLADGHTLVGCTHANFVVEVDRAGKEVWRLANADLPTPLLKDCCGVQRLANGNTVVTSYGAAKADEVKMVEVTPQKRVVWTYRSNLPHGVHEFQILTTNGMAEGTAMK